ncbi:MAG: hypothetical protein AcusKO_20310 [Acuticoccus sp.]
MRMARTALLLVAALMVWGSAALACGPDSDCMIGERRYRIALPPGEGPFGAIVYMHGYKGTAAGVMKNPAMRALAVRLGVALIAAHGEDGDWQIRNYPGSDLADDSREITYFEALLDDVTSRFPVDPARILATGFSSGGMITWTLACHLGERFAAFLPVAGTFWAPIPATCDSAPVDLLHIHGTADKVVPLEGRQIAGTRQGDVAAALAMFADAGGYTPGAPPLPVPPARGAGVRCACRPHGRACTARTLPARGRAQPGGGVDRLRLYLARRTMTGRRLCRLLLAVGLVLAPAHGGAATELAKDAFGRLEEASSSGPARAIGSANALGCLAGAAHARRRRARLSGDAPVAQSAVRPPHADRLRGIWPIAAAAAPALGLDGLLIGDDLTQPRGGPMPYGHTSHQIGLDVDIWLRPMPQPRLSRQARETAPFVSVLSTDGAAIDRSRFTEPLARLMRRAAADPRTARIFVHPLIKKALCEWPQAGEGGGRGWLSRIRPWYGHDAHFHVRLRCPDGSPHCRDQTPPPAGDGCGAPLAYWFTDEPYRPKPGARPKPPLTVARMPAACRNLLQVQ